MAHEAAPVGSRETTLRGIVRAMRPVQWAKNALVYAAPAAAGLAGNLLVMRRTTIALVAFVAVSSAIYLINDIQDVESDRAHPTKRHRPIAAGVVPLPIAGTVAGLLVTAAIALCAMFSMWSVLGVIAVYVVLNLMYSWGLKHVALVEMFVLASGFVLRALAGAVATNVPVSSWFLIVISAGALHVAVSKRLGEFLRIEQTGEPGRAVLARYSLATLTEIRTVAVGVALTAYLLWAFEHAAGATLPVVYELSAVPFALALFRFSAAAQASAEAETPEEILLRDPWMLVYGASWVGLFGVGLLMGAQ